MTVVTAQVICNGQTVNLTKGEGNLWSATFPAPTETSGSNNGGEGPGVGANAQGKGYYPVTIKVTDDAGNTVEVDPDDPTWGTILRLMVLEKTKPTANISYPSQGATIATAKPAIAFSLNDAGSGIDPDEVYIQIDSQPAVKATVQVDGATATGTYTPTDNLEDGQHTVIVYGKDYDGNQSDNATATFTVDTIPPVLNVTSPTENLKINVAALTVAGTTSDATSSPVTVKITVGSQVFNPTVGENGAFSQEVTLSEGANTITIEATDSAGKVTTVTRHVTLDTAGPEISSPTLTPNPVDGGATVTVTVTITDTA